MLFDTTEALAAHKRLKHRLARHVYRDPELAPRRPERPFLCRHCGATDPAMFYPGSKTVCKADHTRLSNLRRKEAMLARISA